MKKHLDLGCGKNPRNKFDAGDLYGVDIIDYPFENMDFNYKKCNLITENLPFQDNYFDSVSAYDLFEHIIRVHFINENLEFPFINLMSEIYRVLKPNGQLYAITPFYPRDSAFVDPTHVNFISKNTHKYFTAPFNWAKMYGFKGSFENLRVRIVQFELEEEQYTIMKNLILKLLNFIYPKRMQHIVWHFSAIKI